MAVEIKKTNINKFLVGYFQSLHLAEMPGDKIRRLNDLRGDIDDAKAIDRATLDANAEWAIHDVTDAAGRRTINGSGEGDEIEVDISNDDGVDFIRTVTGQTFDEIDIATKQAFLHTLTGENYSPERAKDTNKVKFILPAGQINAYREYQLGQHGKLGDLQFPNDRRTADMKKMFDPKTGELNDKFDPSKFPLSDTEWEAFYITVRDTFRAIDAYDSNIIKETDPDNPPKKSNWYGKGEHDIFGPAKLAPTANITNEIGKVLATKLKDRTLRNLLISFGALPDDSTKITEFTSSLENNTFRDDDYHKSYLSKILEAADPEYATSYDPRQKKLQKSLAAIIDGEQKRIKALDGIEFADDDVTKAKLDQFKQPEGYQSILKALYDSKKAQNNRQSQFYKEFAARGGDSITKCMDYAIESRDYSKISGKSDDKLKVSQKISKFVGDKSDEHIKKLWKKSKSHLYIDKSSKGIVDAIVKENVSPTGGLEAILKEKAKIKQRIADNDPNSSKAFDWLIEQLEGSAENGTGSIKDQMPKAFEGALRNGEQSSAIAMALIERGIQGKDDDFANCKTALEVLSVMRYDTFDSLHYADIFKEKFDPFKDATFMQNNAIRFVVNAATLGLNLGMKGAYMTGVMLRNWYQSNRGKLNTEDLKTLKELQEKLERNARDFKTPEEAQAEIDAQTAIITPYETAGTPQEQQLTRFTQVSNLLRRLEERKADIEQFINDYEDKQRAESRRMDFRTELAAEKTRRDAIAAPFDADIQQIQDRMQQDQARLDDLQQKKQGLAIAQNPQIPPNLLATKKAKLAEKIAKADAQIAKAKAKIIKVDQELGNPNTPQNKINSLNATKQALNKSIKSAKKTKKTAKAELAGLDANPAAMNTNLDAEIAAVRARLTNDQAFLTTKQNQKDAALAHAPVTEDRKKQLVINSMSPQDQADYAVANAAEQAEMLEFFGSRFGNNASAPDYMEMHGYDAMDKAFKDMPDYSHEAPNINRLAYKRGQLNLINRQIERFTTEHINLENALEPYNLAKAQREIVEKQLEKLKETRDKGKAVATDEKLYDPPRSPEAKQEYLMWFWNVCNGWVDGMKVNDRNVLRSSKAVRKENTNDEAFKRKWLGLDGGLSM